MSEELQNAMELLQSSYNEITDERDKLKIENGLLQIERTELRESYNTISEDHARLKTENALLVARCARLQKSFDAQHRMHHDTIGKLKDQDQRHKEDMAKMQQHLSGIPVETPSEAFSREPRPDA